MYFHNVIIVLLFIYCQTNLFNHKSAHLLCPLLFFSSFLFYIFSKFNFYESVRLCLAMNLLTGCLSSVKNMELHIESLQQHCSSLVLKKLWTWQSMCFSAPSRGIRSHCVHDSIQRSALIIFLSLGHLVD